jgi:hypothetical protein
MHLRSPSLTPVGAHVVSIHVASDEGNVGGHLSDVGRNSQPLVFELHFLTPQPSAALSPPLLLS